MTVAPNTNRRNAAHYQRLKSAVQTANSLLEADHVPGEYYIDDSDTPPAVIYTHRGETEVVCELARGGYLQRLAAGHDRLTMAADMEGLIRTH